MRVLLAHIQLGGGRDNAFPQRGERHDRLEGRAGREAARKRQLLIDDGQDAAVVRVDHHNAAAQLPQRFEGRLPDDGIVAEQGYRQALGSP